MECTLEKFVPYHIADKAIKVEKTTQLQELKVGEYFIKFGNDIKLYKVVKRNSINFIECEDQFREMHYFTQANMSVRKIAFNEA